MTSPDRRSVFLDHLGEPDLRGSSTDLVTWIGDALTARQELNEAVENARAVAPDNLAHALLSPQVRRNIADTLTAASTELKAYIRSHVENLGKRLATDPNDEVWEIGITNFSPRVKRIMGSLHSQSSPQLTEPEVQRFTKRFVVEVFDEAEDIVLPAIASIIRIKGEVVSRKSRLT